MIGSAARVVVLAEGGIRALHVVTLDEPLLGRTRRRPARPPAASGSGRGPTERALTHGLRKARKRLDVYRVGWPGTGSGMSGLHAAPLPTSLGAAHLRRRRIRFLVATVGALVLLVFAPACSNDDPTPTADATAPDPPPSTTATPTSQPVTTTTAPPTPEQEASAAYLEITARHFRLLENPDSNDPSIAADHSGSNRRAIEEEMRTLAAAGQFVRYPDGEAPIPDVEVTEVEPGSRATLSVCLVDDSQVVDRATEEVVNDVVSSRLGDAVLIRADGAWRLDSQTLRERWADGKGCQR